MKVFYDGDCPLCAKEMQSLQHSDHNKVIQLIDIQSDDFSSNYPGIDKQQALNILHGQSDDGKMHYGLDVTYLAWSAVGKHRWLKLLRIQPVKWFADRAYLFFARNRNSISRLLLANHCKEGVCVSNERQK